MTNESPRSTFKELNADFPDVVTALRTISESIESSGIEKDLIELVKLRASQINECAFCVQFHTNTAHALNVDVNKLTLLAAWRDAGIFSAREHAALAWTERLTRMERPALNDHELWAHVTEQFTDRQAQALTVGIAQINMWNRIGVGLELPPPIPSRDRSE